MRVGRLLRGRASSAERELARAAAHPDLPLVLDEAWYLARHPDVLNAGLDATAHFLSSGVHEWRSPSPYVDLRHVAEALPQARRSGAAALLHLLERGIDRGTPTSPFVDLEWYGRTHGLADAGPRERLVRLVTTGREERHSPSPWIDLDWYADRHAEIHLGGLDPFEYFLSVGRWLQRFPHPCWDEHRYMALNEYVRAAVGSGKYASGFEQFCAAGWEEAARDGIALPLLIDGAQDEYSEERYRADNPDVDALVRDGEVRNALEHFMTVGHRDVVAGRRILKRPSPFSSASIRPTAATLDGDWLVLLNHYDADERLDPHLDTAIDTYRGAGADVVLITTGLDDEARARIAGRVTHIVTKSRNDDLRDFGGWHHALEALGDATLARYERIILTNDSVYFPVRDPEPFLAAVRGTEADVFGATDSVSGGRYHLQSYFLALSPRAVALLRPELSNRIRAQAEASKLTLVQRFEIGLSRFLIEQGLRIEVFLPVREVEDLAAAMCPPDPRRLSPLVAMHTNVTHHLWRRCLEQSLPFLKVDLLRDNPTDADIADWERLVDGACTADLIVAHLERVRR